MFYMNSGYYAKEKEKSFSQSCLTLLSGEDQPIHECRSSMTMRRIGSPRFRRFRFVYGLGHRRFGSGVHVVKAVLEMLGRNGGGF
jgi:hypothetical protein